MEADPIKEFTDFRLFDYMGGRDPCHGSLRTELSPLYGIELGAHNQIAVVGVPLTRIVELHQGVTEGMARQVERNGVDEQDKGRPNRGHERVPGSPILWLGMGPKRDLFVRVGLKGLSRRSPRRIPNRLHDVLSVPTT